MITWRLLVTWPNGNVSTDSAKGNTLRTAKAAAESLKRFYELDGCNVEMGWNSHD
jgi:hypothetical protein